METTVAKALAVLEVLSKAGIPLRVAEIADATGLTRSNCHRLLRTLVDLGYVAQEEETVRYAPTLKTWSVGVLTLNAMPLKRAAAHVIYQLNAATGENVELSVLDGLEILCIDRIAAGPGERHAPAPGERVGAVYPPGGRAILANRSDGEILAQRSVELQSGGLKIDVGALLEEFQRIRARGYALSSSAWAPGLTSAASVIKDRSEPIAAISIGVVGGRATARKLESLGEMTVSAARRIEAILLEH